MTEEGQAMMEGCTAKTPPHVCLSMTMAIDSLTRHSNPACEAMGWEAKMRFEEASWSRLTYDDDNRYPYLHGAWESGTDVIYFTDLGGQSFQHALYTVAHEVSHALWNRPENPRDFDSNNDLIVQQGALIGTGWSARISIHTPSDHERHSAIPTNPDRGSINASNPGPFSDRQRADRPGA